MKAYGLKLKLFLQNLHLEGKNIGPILNGLITNKPVYKHYWKLIKITL